MSEVRVHVWRVGRNSDSHYLLVLRDDFANLLPMAIGPCEALSIWRVLRPSSGSRRPTTHDLLCSLVERLGGKLVKVVIDDLWNKVYYAKLHIAMDGQLVTVDARPSDSIAVALRMDAPLFAVDSVVAAADGTDEECGSPPGPSEADGGLDDQ